MDHPFAYFGGQYCCKTNQEFVGSTNQTEVQSGTCDGIGFSTESTCCKDHAYVNCPHGSGCFDNDLAGMIRSKAVVTSFGQCKELIRLTLTDSLELQETAQVKS